jgi:AraC family transcriptional regulator, regulatory protein of adaptative response / methylated-DNA-[protein]-cysteine methyltransferase
VPSDYTRIDQALAFISENVDGQPDLDAVAAQVGLSPFHFQRLFTRWVGVSPKKFLQYLTLDRAKTCLAQAGSVLDAAHAAGLSGPGRLHDLFVTHEAVTPGEFKLRGGGLTISYGWAESPFGDCLIFTTPRGICGLAFAAENGRHACFEDMRARWPNASFVEDAQTVARLGRAIFARDRRDREKLKLVLYGSPFQVKVWEALLRIPPGALVAYEHIAQAIGTDRRAARAVGSAVGDNPISFLIPCHRVIRNSGVISHYHWGRPRKLALIGWEGVEAAGEREVEPV